MHTKERIDLAEINKDPLYCSSDHFLPSLNFVACPFKYLPILHFNFITCTETVDTVLLDLIYDNADTETAITYGYLKSDKIQC